MTTYSSDISVSSGKMHVSQWGLTYVQLLVVEPFGHGLDILACSADRRADVAPWSVERTFPKTMFSSQSDSLAREMSFGGQTSCKCLQHDGC